jgi:hypothetical protein
MSESCRDLEIKPRQYSCISLDIPRHKEIICYLNSCNWEGGRLQADIMSCPILALQLAPSANNLTCGRI